MMKTNKNKLYIFIANTHIIFKTKSIWEGTNSKPYKENFLFVRSIYLRKYAKQCEG